MNYNGNRKRWERLRLSILKRDNYTCQVSLRYGRHLPANTVHHVFPASKYPEYYWCPWNLIAVDRSVHNSLHIRDTDELTEEGERLRQRIAKKNGIQTDPP